MKAFMPLCAATAVAMSLGVAAQARDFYAGKTITMINGASPGGSSSISCRMLGEYLSKVVPGHPAVILKNMPSESGIQASNFVGLEARKDGLTAMCGAYGPAFQIFGEPNLKVDLTKFAVISGDGSNDVMYARADAGSGLKTGADIFNLPPNSLIFGGIAYNTQKDIKARAILKAYGIDDYKYVTGFNGDSAGRAAIQQKFINLYTEGATAFAGITESALVKTGVVVPIAQAGVLDDNGKRIRDPRLPNIPTYEELYQQHFGKPASGPLWDVIDRISAQQNVAGRWLALPPGSPAQAVTILRNAINVLDKDPAFIAAAEKLRGTGPAAKEWLGAVVQARLDSYLHMPSDLHKLFIQLVNEGLKRQQSN